MGQKINPYGHRLGVTTEWKQPLFSAPEVQGRHLTEDWKIREGDHAPHGVGRVSRIEISDTRQVRVHVDTARPGIVDRSPRARPTSGGC